MAFWLRHNIYRKIINALNDDNNKNIWLLKIIINCAAHLVLVSRAPQHRDAILSIFAVCVYTHCVVVAKIIIRIRMHQFRKVGQNIEIIMLAEFRGPV